MSQDLERPLEKFLLPDVAYRPGQPVTAVMIDGNSLACMAGSAVDGKLRIHAVDHVELDRLVEITRRLRHPIFMDTSFSHFPEKDIARSRLKDFFDRPEFQHPTMVLLAPDKLRIEQLTGDPTPEAAAARSAILLKGCLPMNPYEFPALVRVQESTTGEGQGLTRLGVARMADLLPLVQLVREAGAPYLGCVSALGASAHVARRLHNPNHQNATVLSDLGKLRTLYTIVDGKQNLNWSCIPVGLARDDVHYFRSIELSTDKLITLERSIGRLLFPPESTPSPLFSGFASSPQIDCTRFAIQVSRYAQRCVEKLCGHSAHNHAPRPDCIEPPVHYLAGRASRVPGLRSYMEARLRASVRRVDRRPIRGVTLDPRLTWAQMADNLMLVGALMQAVEPVAGDLPLFQHELVRPPTRGENCTISKLKNDVLYVFEQKVDMV